MLKPIYILLLLLGLSFIYMAFFEMPNASFALANASIQPSCAQPFDLFFGGITKPIIEASFSCMGNPGMKIYRGIESTQDVIYPIVYASFLCLALYVLAGQVFSNATKLNKSRAVFLAIVPMIAMFVDFGENYMIVYLIDHYQHISPQAVLLLNVFNITKWLLVVASVGLCIVFAGIAGYKNFRVSA